MKRLWDRYVAWYGRQQYWLRVTLPVTVGGTFAMTYALLVGQLPLSLQLPAWGLLILGLGTIGVWISVTQRRDFRRIQAAINLRPAQLEREYRDGE